MGKDRVRLNALKAGYHADKIAYQAMIALGEDPREYAETYATLYEWMAPQNGGQVLMVEDAAVIRWQQKRNQRGQVGLIEQQLEELSRRGAKQWQTYEESLADAPQEQVMAHGIATLPDSKGKFERIKDLLDIAIGETQKGKPDTADTVLTIIYGKEDPSMRTARLRDRIEDLTKAPDAAAVREEKKWVLQGLLEEQMKWNQAWLDHLETIRPPSQAERNACFVPKGKAWRALTRQAASLDQRMDKKLRLYWETQKKDRERMVRQHEEAKLEATPEDAAADQEAKEFIEKLMGVINQMNAKLKAAEAQPAAAGETEAEVVGEPSHSTAFTNTTYSTDGQRPVSEAAEKPLGSSAEASADLSEQSEELVENKGAGSENKPETKLSPGD